MAKKGAAKADKGSKKTEQKRKQKVIEDRTFGLKNKNKSKKVQQHIQSVKNNVMNSGDRRQRQLEEQRKKQKAEAKIRKKAALDEQNALFGEALLAIGKKKSTSKKEGKTEAKGRDHEDDGKKGTSRAMKMMYQMDAKEMEERLKEDPNYVPTLEDKIEAERQKKVAQLKASGTGTKVTPETFAAWQDRKRKKRAEEARKLVEAEFKKKKGGKGLAVLSGRALYEYKKDLFDVEGDGTQQDSQEDNNDGKNETESGVNEVAAKVQRELFLEGDDDLDDIEDD